MQTQSCFRESQHIVATTGVIASKGDEFICGSTGLWYSYITIGPFVLTAISLPDNFSLHVYLGTYTTLYRSCVKASRRVEGTYVASCIISSTEPTPAVTM